MVVVDTIGAIAIGGRAGLHLAASCCSSSSSCRRRWPPPRWARRCPDEGGPYVWVRLAFGRFAGALTSLLYWAGTPMWLGGSLTVVAIAVWQRFVSDLSGGWAGTSSPSAFVGARDGRQRRAAALGQVGAVQRGDRPDRAARVLLGHRRRLRRSARRARHRGRRPAPVVPGLHRRRTGPALLVRRDRAAVDRGRGDGQPPARHPGGHRARRCRSAAHVRRADPGRARRPADRAGDLAARPGRRDADRVHRVRRLGRLRTVRRTLSGAGAVDRHADRPGLPVGPRRQRHHLDHGLRASPGRRLPGRRRTGRPRARSRPGPAFRCGWRCVSGGGLAGSPGWSTCGRRTATRSATSRPRSPSPSR